ncbi:MAG: PCRF domain-containing protein [Planctomycetota bacterium]|jgi:protein subunit release factor A
MKEAVIVEIRAGEGGQDAKLLVDKLATVYKKYGDRRSL